MKYCDWDQVASPSSSSQLSHYGGGAVLARALERRWVPGRGSKPAGRNIT